MVVDEAFAMVDEPVQLLSNFLDVEIIVVMVPRVVPLMAYYLDVSVKEVLNLPQKNPAILGETWVSRLLSLVKSSSPK